MKRNHSGENSPEEIRVLLLGVWKDERAALEPLLAAEPRFRLLPASTFADATPSLEAGTVDVLLCDLDVYRYLRRAPEGSPLEPLRVSTLVLVSPGEEERAADLLEHEPAEFLLRAGNYRILLPAWLRRAARQRDTDWEEVGSIIRHEINNPLTGVLGNAELILAEGPALPAKVRRRLTTIVELAVRLRDVVRSLEARLAQKNRLTQDGPAPVSHPPAGLVRPAAR